MVAPLGASSRSSIESSHPDGMRLFRRDASIEVWKGDELLESTAGRPRSRG